MNTNTTIILILSLIGFIYLLFKLRLSFKEEVPKWMRLFIRKEEVDKNGTKTKPN